MLYHSIYDYSRAELENISDVYRAEALYFRRNNPDVVDMYNHLADKLDEYISTM